MFDEDRIISALLSLRADHEAAIAARRMNEPRRYEFSSEELARKLMPRERNWQHNYEQAIGHLCAKLEEYRPSYPRITKRGPWRIIRTHTDTPAQQCDERYLHGVLLNHVAHHDRRGATTEELAARVANPYETEEEQRAEHARLVAELELRRPTYKRFSKTGRWYVEV